MKTVQIVLKVPETWRDKVKKMGKEKGMSIQVFIKHLIAIEEEKERNGK